MAVTVGRIEYVVGADGRVLEKEARDAARSAGKSSGQQYSDDFIKEVRKKWGSASGFASVLGKEDRKVLKQFQKTGALAGQEFRDRFEKNLVPGYQKIAKKMIAAFEGLKFDPLNGVNSELNRIFGTAEDVEREMRKVKGVLDELSATARMGIIDRNTFDITGVNKLRGALQEVFDTGNWEMLSASQRRIRDEMWAQAEAAEEQERILLRRQEILDRQNTLEKQLSYEMGRQLTVIERMIVDRNALAELSEDEQVAILSQHLGLEKIRETNREIARQEHDRYDMLARTAELVDYVFSLPAARQTGTFGELSKEIREANAALEVHTGHITFLRTASKKTFEYLHQKWNDIDNDIRLVISLIISAADQIATLGSAGGAGLLALGTAATTAIGGLLGFVSVIGTLNQDLDTLPPELQAVAREMQGFGSAFGDLRTQLAIGASTGFGAAFSSLRDTLQSLELPARAFGNTLGDVFAGFARKVKPGTEALQDIINLIDTAAGLLPGLSSATGVWAGALVRGLDRAAPLAEDLLGWIETLGKRFDQFTRDDAFGEWLENAQTIFGELGGLLDQIGRSLNDLVTPESVQRTAELLQNLTRLIPGLEALLDIFGRADIIGILVVALAEVGETLQPLQEGLGEVADALRAAFIPALEGAGAVLEAVAALIGPFIQALGLIAGAVPESVWVALGVAVTAYATAFYAFKGIQAVIPILTSVQTAAVNLFDSLTGRKVNQATGAVDKLTDRFGKAGLVGSVAAAAVGIGLFVNDAIRDLTKLDSKFEDLVASGGGITEAWETVNSSLPTLTRGIDDYGAAIDHLKAKQENFFVGAQSLWSEQVRSADVLGQAISELDAPMAKLATKSLPQAQKAFQQMAEDMGLTDEQTAFLLTKMPKLEGVFKDAAGGSDGLATSQEALEYAMGRSTDATEENIEELEGFRDIATEAQGAISELAEQIRNFGQTTLDSREAQRGFLESVQEAKDTFAELAGEIQITNGEIAIHNEAGREMQASLDEIASSSREAAAAILEETGSQELANAAIQMGRDELIKMLEQLGITGPAAEDYADKLGLVQGAAEGATGADETMRAALGYTLEQFGLNRDEAQTYIDKLAEVPGDIDTFVEILNAIPSINTAEEVKQAIDNIDAYKKITIDVIYNAKKLDAAGNPSFGLGSVGVDAAGRIANTPQLSIWAEDGPEAIVPLRRPLSRVDPSVRALSAFAQGLPIPGQQQPIYAGPPSRSVTFGEGSIVVQGAMNAERTALSVANRVAEKVAG